MTTAYTSLLGLALPVTAELDGTWGNTVNNYITEYTDASVAGTQTISGSQTAVTLSITNGTSLSQAGSGGTGSAQYQVINCTGSPAGLLTITAPASSKTYVVINATSTSQSVKIVGAGPTTGVTVAAGRAALVAWNGSDFALISTTDLSKLLGTLAVTNGGTGQTSYTDGQLLIGNSSGNTLTKATLTAGANITITNGAGAITIAATTNTGDVVGPASATANAIALFDGTTGKLLKDSATLLPTGAIVGTSDTQTLTNKRIDPRVVSAASAASLTPSIGTADIYAYTALAAGLTINAPTGTPLDGDKLIFRFLDNGTSRSLTWNATYTAIGVTLPTATTISKTTYVGCIYNANNTRWDVIAVTTQA